MNLDQLSLVRNLILCRLKIYHATTLGVVAIMVKLRFLMPCYWFGCLLLLFYVIIWWISFNSIYFEASDKKSELIKGIEPITLQKKLLQVNKSVYKFWECEIFHLLWTLWSFMKGLRVITMQNLKKCDKIQQYTEFFTIEQNKVQFSILIVTN